MHAPINVKSPNNISKWQMGFNSAFKGLRGVYCVHKSLYIKCAYRWWTTWRLSSAYENLRSSTVWAIRRQQQAGSSKALTPNYRHNHTASYKTATYIVNDIPFYCSIYQPPTCVPWQMKIIPLNYVTYFVEVHYSKVKFTLLATIMSWTRPMYCYRSVFLQFYDALQQKRSFASIVQSDVLLITRMLCGELAYCLRSVATQYFQSLHQTVTRFETTWSVHTRCSEQKTLHFRSMDYMIQSEIASFKIHPKSIQLVSVYRSLLSLKSFRLLISRTLQRLPLTDSVYHKMT
jgi:hypothetical protein